MVASRYVFFVSFRCVHVLLHLSSDWSAHRSCEYQRYVVCRSKSRPSDNPACCDKASISSCFNQLEVFIHVLLDIPLFQRS